MQTDEFDCKVQGVLQIDSRVISGAHITGQLFSLQKATLGEIFKPERADLIEETG